MDYGLSGQLEVVVIVRFCCLELFSGGKGEWMRVEGRKVRDRYVDGCLLSPISTTTSPSTHPSPLQIGHTCRMSDEV